MKRQNLENVKRNGAKLKDNGVNAVGMKDVRRGNSQKGNTKVKNARIKAAWNKSYLNPEEDPRFHEPINSYADIGMQPMPEGGSSPNGEAIPAEIWDKCG